MQFSKSLIGAAVALSLTACGGSGSSGGGNSQTPSATDNNASSTVALPDTIIGKISASTSDSVTVNDYELNLSGVDVTYFDEDVTRETLTVDMPVIVYSVDDVVTEIAIDPDIAGQVTAIDDSTITIAGITYSHSGLAAFAVGDYLFAVLAPDATIVQAVLASQGSEPLWTEIEGFVTSLDTSTSSFTTNDIAVDYSNAVIEDGTLAEGNYAEITGNYLNGIFYADEIDIERPDYNGETEIAGVITWVNETNTVFELSDLYTFEIVTSTQLEDGATSDLVLGAYVEATIIEGVLTELDFESTNGTSTPPINTTTSTKFSVSGVMSLTNSTLNFNGYEFDINNSTRFEDGLTIDTLTGVALEIEGVVRDGRNQVREIERMDTDNDLDLEGQVDNVTLWGYATTDNSLSAWADQWVDVECTFDGTSLSNCVLDN